MSTEISGSYNNKKTCTERCKSFCSSIARQKPPARAGGLFIVPLLDGNAAALGQLLLHRLGHGDGQDAVLKLGADILRLNVVTRTSVRIRFLACLPYSGSRPRGIIPKGSPKKSSNKFSPKMLGNICHTSIRIAASLSDAAHLYYPHCITSCPSREGSHFPLSRFALIITLILALSTGEC